MEKKINNILVIATMVFLSICTLHSTAYASSQFRVYSESTYSRKPDIQNLADINLLFVNQSYSSYIPAIIRPVMNSLSRHSLMGISSSFFDDADTDNNISSRRVASAPEPVTLLLIGIGLMGIALYRKLKNK